MRLYLMMFVFLWAALSFSGCDESNFAGTSVPRQPSKADAGDEDSGNDGGEDSGEDSGEDGGGSDRGGLDQGSDSGGGSDLGEDGGSGEDGGLEIDDEQFVAKQCTGTNGEVTFDECPKGMAAFLSDDGSTTRVGCCALPSSNIFAKNSQTIDRGASCGPDEIAVGASGGGYKCRAINTELYFLAPAQTACYWGSGASGNNGSRDCSQITSALAELIGKTGDQDGCAAFPYGAVFVAKSKKYCGNQSAAVIMDKKTNQPVKIFP